MRFPRGLTVEIRISAQLDRVVLYVLAFLAALLGK